MPKKHVEYAVVDSNLNGLKDGYLYSNLGIKINKHSKVNINTNVILLDNKYLYLLQLSEELVNKKLILLNNVIDDIGKEIVVTLLNINDYSINLNNDKPLFKLIVLPKLTIEYKNTTKE